MRLVSTAVLASALAAGLPAAAFDLTGNWEGAWSCSEFHAGEKTKDSDSEVELSITSLGDGTFRAVMDGLHYRGVEIPDASDPDRGEIALIYCGSDDDLATGDATELGRLRVSTSGTRGSLSGISVWSDASDHIATCKYKFTRVNTTNPNLTYPCPPV